MMRPDELRKKANELDALEREAATLRRVETISSGVLCYSGHQSTSLTDDEVAVVRKALVDHYQDRMTVRAGRLRALGVDSSSIFSLVARL